MIAILSVAIGAILTAVLGNFLVQRWQMRSWRAQQRHLGLQIEFEALKLLAEEIISKASNRLFAMRHVTGALAPNSQSSLDDTLAKYRQELALWNTSLASFYVRLRLYLNYSMAIRLENEVHKPFVQCGLKIEALLNQSKSGKTVSLSERSEIIRELNKMQGKLNDFGAYMLRTVESRKKEIFYGHKIILQKSELDKYSTLELIKAFLTRDVDGFYVIRSP